MSEEILCYPVGNDVFVARNESLVVDFHTTLEANGIGSDYELFHCMTCGKTWEYHTGLCFNHKSKDKCIHVRNLVKDTPEARRLFTLAIKDGFSSVAGTAQDGSLRSPGEGI